MGLEIERKFLVAGNWKKKGMGARCRQGYLSLDPQRTVRVRTKEQKGYLTIKGITRGIVRQEFEYHIPFEDAEILLDEQCIQPVIEKNRYHIEYQGFVWQVDEFLGENEGLIIAEVELDHADQKVPLPSWVDKEVSGDPRYYNASLVRAPWKTWHK